MGSFHHRFDDIFSQAPGFDVVALAGRLLLEGAVDVGSSQNNSTHTVDDGYTEFLKAKLSFTKKCAIIRSSTGSISCMASVLIVWMILRSHVGLSSPFHRLLFGLSIADILSSFFHALSSIMAPSDVDYYIWNARGNVTTCNLQGFFYSAGFYACALYTCSLCLYYLAVVRYEKSNEYIRKKYEVYLHAIPVVVALITGITFVAIDGNNPTPNGLCTLTPYDPPHCKNYEAGVVPAGYTVPCGRGSEWVPAISLAFILPMFIIVPSVIVGCMTKIYRTVLKNEQTMEKYGAGMLRIRSAQQSGANLQDDSTESCWGIGMRIRSTFSRNNNITESRSSTRRLNSNSRSRAILYKGIAYSMGFFLSWLFIIIATCLVVAGMNIPVWVTLCYFIFVPLQGFYNFIIFMYPRIMTEKRRKRRKVSWRKAFCLAFWSKGGKRSRRSGGSGAKTRKQRNNNTDGAGAN